MFEGYKWYLSGENPLLYYRQGNIRKIVFEQIGALLDSLKGSVSCRFFHVIGKNNEMNSAGVVGLEECV